MTPRQRRVRDESGAVAILVGLLLPILLGFTGLALDIGHWYLAANREQKAADAAALAGAVYLPGDPDKAIDVARDYASRNGYTADVDTVVDPAQQANPVQLRVTISHTVDNFFILLFGMPRTTITRTAVAEFQGPVPMGSPANTYGDEPVGAGERRWSNTYTSASNQPHFWGNVAGPRSTKTNGDAYQGAICSGADGCDGSTNTDYSADGYFYSVTVPSAGKLAIEIFDPAFVNVGDHCDQHLDNATTATNPYVTDATTRYAKNSSAFCTGDQLFTGGAGDGVPPTTTYIFRSPTDTPWDPTSAPVINTSTCSPKQYKGYDLDLKAPLTGTYPSGSTNDVLQQVFRRWNRVCTFNAPTAGTYYVQVRTNVAIGNPTGVGSRTFPGGGHNRYSIRAALLDGAGNPTGAGVKIEATSAMGIYANAPSATTQFFLARVPSGSGGHTLVLKFFDISDAGTGSTPPRLTILPPLGEGPVTQFRNCVASGPQTGLLPTCVINPSGAFNGRWEEVQVPIPDNYACNDLSPTGCWVKIKYEYGTDAQVQDTTTWTAYLDGDPVRIVE